MREPQPCGTYAAYQRHRKHGENACQPCLDALRDYQQNKRSTETRLCSQGCGEPMVCRTWCRACYERWLDTDRTSDTPPPLGARTYPAPKREMYLRLREEGVTRKAAARQLGVRLNATYNWEPAPPKTKPVPNALGDLPEHVRVDAAKVRLVVAGLAAGSHPCELSKSRGITVCGHPGHVRDKAALEQALTLLGLVEGDTLTHYSVDLVGRESVEPMPSNRRGRRAVVAA